MKWTLELATLGGPIEVTDEDGRVVAYVNTGTRGVKDPKEAERIGRLVAAAPDTARRVAYLEWMLSPGHGVSAETILRTFDRTLPNNWHLTMGAPSDKHDMGRCVRLLRMFPEIAEAFPTLVFGPEWDEWRPRILDALDGEEPTR